MYKIIFMICLCGASFSFAQPLEISGSPFDVEGSPLPQSLPTKEKTILIDPQQHFYGAYQSSGKLLRWGIATTGAYQCENETASCKTSTGTFRIYSLGNENCISAKFNGAQMPYCMYFNGGEAIHGSTEIQSANLSHGCVRVHIDDAKWLRYQFVEGPTKKNQFRGTKVVILSY